MASSKPSRTAVTLLARQLKDLENSELFLCGASKHAFSHISPFPASLRLPAILPSSLRGESQVYWICVMASLYQE